MIQPMCLNWGCFEGQSSSRVSVSSTKAPTAPVSQLDTPCAPVLLPLLHLLLEEFPINHPHGNLCSESTFLGIQSEILSNHQNVFHLKLNLPWIASQIFHWKISNERRIWTCTLWESMLVLSQRHLSVSSQLLLSLLFYLMKVLYTHLFI